MNKGFQRFVLLLLAALWLGLGFARAAESLVWHNKEKTFDADVTKMDLHNLLQQISKLTGWEIYLEPGISLDASAKFKKRPQNEALRLLLGKLNFEISPASNSVPKLFVFRTGARNATERIDSEKRASAKVEIGKPIPNQLIVTLKPGSKMSIEVLAQQLGAKVIGKLKGLNAYLLEFPDEAAANAARDQLSNVSDVASVDSNIALGKPEPVNMASVNGNVGSPFNLKASANGGDGHGVVVGLIDTAVQQLGADMQGFLLPALSVSGDSSLNGDLPTHGTSMAESILFGANSMLDSGQGTSLRILPVDIYGNDEGTTTFRVASGVTMAVNNGANIISLSLGSEGDSPFLGQLLQQVRDKGILVFAAAGNEPVTTPTFPAAYPSVIAVTSAQNGRGDVAPYANRGDFVDVILPGATLIYYKDSTWYVNGTSVSTAIASGMMAGLSEHTQTPPAQLEPTFRDRLHFQPPPQ